MNPCKQGILGQALGAPLFIRLPEDPARKRPIHAGLRGGALRRRGAMRTQALPPGYKQIKNASLAMPGITPTLGGLPAVWAIDRQNGTGRPLPAPKPDEIRFNKEKPPSASFLE